MRQPLLPAPDSSTLKLPEMFTCSRRSLQITAKGCGNSWGKANQVKRVNAWLGAATCRGCPIGAWHATGRVAELPHQVAEAASELQKFCSRCERRTDRIIWPKEHGLCASCDARHREAIRGRDSRGKMPSLAGLLHTERMVVTTGGITRVHTRQHVISASEVRNQLAKFATQPMAFSAQPPARPAGALIRCYSDKGNYWADQLELSPLGGWAAAPVREVCSPIEDTAIQLHLPLTGGYWRQPAGGFGGSGGFSGNATVIRAAGRRAAGAPEARRRSRPDTFAAAQPRTAREVSEIDRPSRAASA